MRRRQTRPLFLEPGRYCTADKAVPGQARVWLAPLLAGLGAYAVAIGAARSLLNDGDTLSHIAIGRWIIAHHALPFQDPFSFTLFGHNWVPHEWLAETAFAALYDWVGWGGVVAATALATAAAFALLTAALQRSLGPRRAAIGAALAFLLTEAHLLARPHVLALPLLVIWMAAVIRARDESRTPSLALLPVMVLWCNLHGGFVVGLLFTTLLGVEAMLEAPAAARRRAAMGWGVFLGLSFLAGLISPNGIELYLLPLRMLDMSFAISAISEWRAATFQGFEPLEVWVLLAVLGGFSLGLRLPWTRTLMLLLLLHLALSHIRNAELLGIIGPLLLAAPLAAHLGGRENRPALAGHPHPLAVAATGSAAALVFLASALALDRFEIHPRGDVAPRAAVEAAREAGLTGPVLNSLRFGGYLMFIGTPTFIDGRADLFGDAFLRRYAMATAGLDDALPELLDEYAVAWTMLEPHSPAVTLLDHLPGWKRAHTDPDVVIHRRAAPWPPARRNPAEPG